MAGRVRSCERDSGECSGTVVRSTGSTQRSTDSDRIAAAGGASKEGYGSRV